MVQKRKLGFRGEERQFCIFQNCNQYRRKSFGVLQQIQLACSLLWLCMHSKAGVVADTKMKQHKSPLQRATLLRLTYCQQAGS